MGNIKLEGLTHKKLIEKITLLLKGIKPRVVAKFVVKANWNEDGMTIIIGLE